MIEKQLSLTAEQAFETASAVKAGLRMLDDVKTADPAVERLKVVLGEVLDKLHDIDKEGGNTEAVSDEVDEANLFYYMGHFVSDKKGRTSKHTREFRLEQPLEYATDIEAVQLWFAKEVGADFTVLLSWRELKGFTRPGSADHNNEQWGFE